MIDNLNFDRTLFIAQGKKLPPNSGFSFAPSDVIRKMQEPQGTQLSTPPVPGLPAPTAPSLPEPVTPAVPPKQEPSLLDDPGHKLQKRVAQSAADINMRPEIQGDLKTVVARAAGTTPENIQEEALSSMVDAMRNLNRLTSGLEIEENSLLARIEKGDSITEQEGIGLALVAALPLILGLVAGGSEGLEAGLLAAMGSSGTFLSEREKQRPDLKEELQTNRALQLQATTQKMNVAQSLIEAESNRRGAEMMAQGIDPEKLPRLREISAIASVVGAEINNPTVALEVQDEELRELRRFTESHMELERIQQEMIAIIEEGGGGLAMDVPLIGEFGITDRAVRLKQLQDMGLSIVRNYQRAGANLTGIEVELGEAIIPDITGLFRGLESGQPGGRALQRIKDAQRLLKNQTTTYFRTMGIHYDGQPVITDPKTGKGYKATGERNAQGEPLFREIK